MREKGERTRKIERRRARRMEEEAERKGRERTILREHRLEMTS